MEEQAPNGYHWSEVADFVRDFKVGDVVDTECADWEWDNPMTVVAVNMHGYGDITCIGQSGVMYDEVIEAFVPHDRNNAKVVMVKCLIRSKTQEEINADQ